MSICGVAICKHNIEVNKKLKSLITFNDLYINEERDSHQAYRFHKECSEGNLTPTPFDSDLSTKYPCKLNVESLSEDNVDHYTFCIEQHQDKLFR